MIEGRRNVWYEVTFWGMWTAESVRFLGVDHLPIAVYVLVCAIGLYSDRVLDAFDNPFVYSRDRSTFVRLAEERGRL